MIACSSSCCFSLGSRVMAGIAVCLLLAMCATSGSETKWVKAGANDQTVLRELQDCMAQANKALASEQGINQDISATLGRNWQLGQTTPVVDQSMRQQAQGYSDRVLNSCMRAKGFTKEG
jgi:hypothetical protein